MKRAGAIILFALLLIGGFRPMFVRLLVTRRELHQPGPPDGLDRRPLRQREDPTSPEMRAFLERVRSQTHPGDSISLDCAPPHDGWSYSYWRASYVLSGRTIKLPGDMNANMIVSWPAEAIERRR